MTTRPLDDLIAKARAQPRPHVDVDITLDDTASEQIAALEADLADALDTQHDAAGVGDDGEQVARLRAELEAAQASAVDSVIVLRFRRLAPAEWADFTARNPMRYDAVTDRVYGYNVHGVAREAAPASGMRVVHSETGDVEEDVTPEQWDSLLELVAGRDFNRVADAIFTLNEWGPQQRLDAARKASRAGIDVTSS